MTLQWRHPNRSGRLRTNYMIRKQPRKGNPYRKRGLAVREVACWYCIPGNPQKYIQEVEMSYVGKGYYNDDEPEPTKEQQDFTEMENYILDLEEQIEELEDHLVHDHECFRPSVFDRVSVRDERKSQ